MLDERACSDAASTWIWPRIAASEARLRAAEDALRLADARFRQGARLLLEVLDAQTAFPRARTERVGALAPFDCAQFRLL